MPEAPNTASSEVAIVRKGHGKRVRRCKLMALKCKEIKMQHATICTLQRATLASRLQEV